MQEITFQETLESVSAINSKLRDKGFDLMIIDKFWSNIIRLIPKIKKIGIDNIKVCTGCGRLNIEELPKQYKSCCRESNYKPIN